MIRIPFYDPYGVIVKNWKHGTEHAVYRHCRKFVLGDASSNLTRGGPEALREYIKQGGDIDRCHIHTWVYKDSPYDHAIVQGDI